MIRVFITDDHAVVRRGVRQILEDCRDIVVVGEAGSGGEALRALSTVACDVALMDIHLPDINGIEMVKQLRESQPDLRVLILSMYPEEQYALRALQAGAYGYLTKESAPDELVSAVRKTALGGKYITASLAEKLAHLVDGKTPRAAHEQLSDREYQVMCLLAEGKSISEIGTALALSVKTISTYRARILEKLGVSSTAEIMRYAIEKGLVE